MERIYDLAYEIDGDSINLEQGEVEPSRLTLHRVHIELLAKKLGVTQAESKDAARHCRHLHRLRDGIEELDALLRSVPCFPPGSGPTDEVLMSGNLLELANKFCGEEGDVIQP